MLTPAIRMPRLLHRAEHPLGMRHEHREAAVRRGYRGDALRRAVRVIRVGFSVRALVVQPALVSLLLEAGISAASRGACGTPLLSHAISSGDAGIVRLLRSSGARADNEGAALAAAAGQHEAVELLLQRGAPADPALLHAAQRDDMEMSDLIYAARAAQLLVSGADRVTGAVEQFVR
jgi:hypothetical protein